MTIKFEKETRRLKTMICLSGRLQAKHLEELKTQLEGNSVADCAGPQRSDARGCRDRSISERL